MRQETLKLFIWLLGLSVVLLIVSFSPVANLFQTPRPLPAPRPLQLTNDLGWRQPSTRPTPPPKTPNSMVNAVLTKERGYVQREMFGYPYDGLDFGKGAGRRQHGRGQLDKLVPERGGNAVKAMVSM